MKAQRKALSILAAQIICDINYAANHDYTFRKYINEIDIISKIKDVIKPDDYLIDSLISSGRAFKIGKLTPMDVSRKVLLSDATASDLCIAYAIRNYDILRMHCDLPSIEYKNDKILIIKHHISICSNAIYGLDGNAVSLNDYIKLGNDKWLFNIKEATLLILE